MNILIHYYRLGHYIGGAEVVALNQCSEILRQGHNVTILTADTGHHSKIFDEFLENNPKIKLVELPLEQIHKTGDTWIDIDLESLQFGRYAAEHFYKDNTEQYDLVVIHNKTDALFVPSRYKTVIHLHGTPTKFDHLMELALYNTSGLLAVSESVKDGWQQNVKSIRKEISVIHNGIDTSIFRNTNQNRDIDVLFVGRLYPHKGIIELLQATKQLNLKLLVVGAGPLEEELAKHNHVTHLKNLETEKLVEIYNRAKIFACPSSAKEGVLTTMLEAAICGCAIITADCAGMVDFAKHMDNTILVPPSDPSSLAQAISLLIKNDELRNKLAKKAQNDATSQWNIENQTNKLLAFYKEISCK